MIKIVVFVDFPFTHLIWIDKILNKYYIQEKVDLKQKSDLMWPINFKGQTSYYDKFASLYCYHAYKFLKRSEFK